MNLPLFSISDACHEKLPLCVLCQQKAVRVSISTFACCLRRHLLPYFTTKGRLVGISQDRKGALGQELGSLCGTRCKTHLSYGMSPWGWAASDAFWYYSEQMTGPYQLRSNTMSSLHLDRHVSATPSDVVTAEKNMVSPNENLFSSPDNYPQAVFEVCTAVRESRGDIL